MTAGGTGRLDCCLLPALPRCKQQPSGKVRSGGAGTTSGFIGTEPRKACQNATGYLSLLHRDGLTLCLHPRLEVLTWLHCTHHPLSCAPPLQCSIHHRPLVHSMSCVVLTPFPTCSRALDLPPDGGRCYGGTMKYLGRANQWTPKASSSTATGTLARFCMYARQRAICGWVR